MLKWIKAVLLFPVWVIKQLALTLFDDFEFKYISLPRVWCAISGLCIVYALIAEIHFGIKFSGWTQLVAWASTCLGAYVGKKYTERGNNNASSNTGGHPDNG